MKVILLIPFLLVSVFSFAQKQHIVNLEPSEITLPQRQFFISKVIDNRQNKETIGFVQKGLANKRIQANFSEFFTNTMQKVVNTMIPPNPSLIPIILKVNNLYISETTTAFKEVGMAEINVEFILADSSASLGRYEEVIKKNGADVTKKHDERILTAIESCLTQLQQRWEVAIKEKAPISADASFDPTVPLKKGIYQSFSDFVRNEPDTSIPFELALLSKKLKKYKLQSPKRQKELKNIYGVSDGIHFYLNAVQYSYQNYFVKAHYTGTYFYFQDKIGDPNMSIAFGLVGALASNKKTGIVLDTQTGLISELNRDFLANKLKDYPELRQQYNKTDRKIEGKKYIVQKLNEVLEMNEK